MKRRRRHLAAGAVILQRDLQAGFHRLRAAGDEDHALEAAAARSVRRTISRQLLQRIGGEGVAIAMGDPVELRLDRLR